MHTCGPQRTSSPTAGSTWSSVLASVSFPRVSSTRRFALLDLVRCCCHSPGCGRWLAPDKSTVRLLVRTGLGPLVVGTRAAPAGPKWKGLPMAAVAVVPVPDALRTYWSIGPFGRPCGPCAACWKGLFP